MRGTGRIRSLSFIRSLLFIRALFLMVCASTLGIGEARASIVPNSVLPLSPSAQGNPRFQFSAAALDNLFTVARGVVGNSASCAAGETLSYEAASNMSWCTRLAFPGSWAGFGLAAQGSIWTYTDKAVLLDETGIQEYKYRIKTMFDPVAAFVAVWTASCPIDAVDPLLSWINTFNQHSGSSTPLLTRAHIPDPYPNNPGLAKLTPVSATFTNANGSIPITLYVLSNDRYVAVFGPLGTLAGLTHRSLGGEFINFTYPHTPVWQPAWIVSAGRPDDANPRTLVPGNSPIDPYTFLPTTIVNFNDGNGALTFTWSGFSADSGFAGVSVANTWRLSSPDGAAGASGLRGSIAVSGHPDNGGFLDVRFPLLYGLGASQLNGQAQQTSTLLWPEASNTGRLFADYNSALLQKSGTLLDDLQMPFFGVLSGGAALYVAAEDPVTRPKSFYFQNYWSSAQCPSTGKCVGTSFIRHYPMDGTGVAGNSLAPDYDVVLKPMCGGWERVAKQYRSWATKQSWALSGSTPKTLKNRAEIPLSVRNGLFWWNADSGPNATPGRARNYIQNTLKPLIGPDANNGGVPVGIHLYQWYTLPMDYDTPIFIEKLPGADPYNYTESSPVVSVPDLISTVQSDGSVVLPYINGGTIDISNRAFPDYTGFYGGGIGCGVHSYRGFWDRTLSYGGYTGPVNGAGMDFGMLLARPAANLEDRVVMCLFNPEAGNESGVQMVVDPSLPQWQGIVDDNVNRVFGLGAGGVYLDAFAKGYSPDFSAAHGHGGHGTWWLAGRAAIAANAAGAAVNAESDAGAAVFKTAGVRRVTAQEFFLEPLLQSIDLLMNYSPAQPQDVPVLGSVYSGYQIMVGGANHRAVSDRARAAVFGRSFVWGNQLLAYGVDRLCNDRSNCPWNHPVVVYVRNLAKARNTAFLNDYLAYGELLQLVDDLNPVNTLSYSGADRWCLSDSCPGTLPVVRGARWRSGSSPAAELIVLTNTNLAAAVDNVEIQLPLGWQGAATLCNYDNSGCAAAAVQNNRALLSLAAGAIKVLKKN